ncbi:hypothetical protein IWW34DRAFT_804950 [Fusarium oxysporum f. sp. albedinis]|nr:hypothetical protein IWW34DRAFT_804950 [Fusarium oxysporum f. sp. albedinis]
MCVTIFWVHECVFCGVLKDNSYRYDPEVTGACPEFEEKLEWRYWVCPPCEEANATDERKFPPRGQRQQQRGTPQQFQSGSGGHTVQQYPSQQGEQSPQFFPMGHPPRHQNEPRPQGRRESHGHHHHY